MMVSRQTGTTLLLTILMFGAAHSVQAQVSRADQMSAAAETIKGWDIFRDVTYIASDANKGRATPSPGFDSAATFIARGLKEIGIKPMGDSGGYFLHYTVTQSILDTITTSGSLGSQSLKWGDDFVVNSFLLPGVRQANVVYVSHGIRSKKAGLDPYAGIDIKGKWVLMHNGFGRAPTLPDGVTIDKLGTVGVDYTTATEEVKARGALGILLVPSSALVAGWRRAATIGRDLNPSVGRTYAKELAPRVVLSRAIIERLFAGSKVSASDVLSADSTHRYPQSIDLGSSKRLKIDFRAATSDVHPYNVVGLLEGSDPKLKDEWVSLSAHLDGAVGRGALANGDSIFNAADDDGSGSAGNLAVARALAGGPHPKRSVLLIWDSGEEVGLWGSRSLAYGPLAKRIVAHFSDDMIGRSKVPGTNEPGENDLTGPGEMYVTGPGLMSSVMDSALVKVTREFQFGTVNRKYEANTTPTHEFFYPRTDAGPYMENGIPVAMFYTGQHADYHRQGDEISRLDPLKMQAVSQTIYAMLWLTAESATRPRMDKPVPSTLWFVTPRR